MRCITLLLFTLALAHGKTIPQIRIIGGSNAIAGQFPYQASLRTAANGHFCGGTIISNRWILSAAHCTYGRTTANTKIVVGALLRLTGGVTHNTATIINHPSYDDDTVAYDVSLVQTSDTIVFNQLTAAIALGSTAVGVATGTVSGWGQTSNPGNLADTLQHFSVSTLTNENCITKHTEDHKPMIFAHKMCTFSVNGQGVCMGDSGGPLVISNTVAGIVSWIIPCGVGYPDVYDRVAFHRTWILGYVN